MSDGLRRAAEGTGDLFGALGLVLCLPFVVLAFGLPVALIVRLVSWATSGDLP